MKNKTQTKKKREKEQLQPDQKESSFKSNVYPENCDRRMMKIFQNAF